MQYVIVNLNKPDEWNNHFILNNLKRNQVYKIDTLNVKGQVVAVVYFSGENPGNRGYVSQYDD